MAGKAFRSRLRREVRLRVREMRDGCLECRACRGLCPDHWKEAVALVLSPRKEIGMGPAKGRAESEGG